jgi:dTDP-4-dehydrorhamnose reductase
MKRAILTGMNGTVAPALARRLGLDGCEVVAWNRSEVAVDDVEAGARFLDKAEPDTMVHLAMGAPEWAAWLAAQSLARGIRFLYVSSVSVFSGQAPGPITPDREPDATDDYGSYKAACELQVRAVHPDAVIARLGWQIDNDPRGNTMVRYLVEQMRNEGVVSVSRAWIPSTSFLSDTADALATLLADADARGPYHLEANDGFSMFHLARRLNERFALGLRIEGTDAFAFDNRMVDERLRMKRLSERLDARPDAP